MLYLDLSDLWRESELASVWIIFCGQHLGLFNLLTADQHSTLYLELLQSNQRNYWLNSRVADKTYTIERTHSYFMCFDLFFVHSYYHSIIDNFVYIYIGNSNYQWYLYFFHNLVIDFSIDVFTFKNKELLCWNQTKQKIHRLCWCVIERADLLQKMACYSSLFLYSFGNSQYFLAWLNGYVDICLRRALAIDLYFLVR